MLFRSERIGADFAGRVSIEILGITTRRELPKRIDRIGTSAVSMASYPGFVNWMRNQRCWDIGLAPLEDSAFTRRKSQIKTLDYAAAGAAVLASDGPVYRGSVADGPGGMLVSNKPEAWYAALSRLIRDRTLRRSLQQGAWDAYLARGTLGTNLAAWDFLLAP